MATARERRKNNILKNSTDIFLEKGISDTSMESIAGRSGVSRRTLYRYFETREELAYEVLIGLMDEWNIVQQEIYNSLRGKGIECLEQFLYALINHMKDHRDFMRFTGEFDYYFKDDSSYKPNEELLNRFESSIHQTEDLLDAILIRGAGDGSIFIDGDRRLLVYTITNVLWSYGQRIAIRGKGIKEEFDVDPMDIIFCQVDLYVKGMKNV